MFERFTEPARQVVVLAQEEARALQHNYIGTEHILLGLLREWDGLAHRVLDSMGITIQEVRAQVASIVGHGEELATGQIPFTPRAKKVLELSMREALALGHNYIGTEHLLLALARENNGVAVRILMGLGAHPERVKREVLGLVSGDEPSRSMAPASVDEPVWKVSPSGVQYMVVTHGLSDGRPRLLGLWLAAPTVVLAVAVLFGLGLLVGWLIWG